MELPGKFCSSLVPGVNRPQQRRSGPVPAPYPMGWVPAGQPDTDEPKGWDMHLQSPHQCWVRCFLAGAFALAVAACGGDGGGDGDKTAANGTLGTGVTIDITGEMLSFQDSEGDQWTYRKRPGSRSASAVSSDLVGSWELIDLEGAPGPVNETNSVWTFYETGTYIWFFFYPNLFDLSGTGQWNLIGNTLYLDGIVAETVLAGMQGPDSGYEVVVNPKDPTFLKPESVRPSTRSHFHPTSRADSMWRGGENPIYLGLCAAFNADL